MSVDVSGSIVLVPGLVLALGLVLWLWLVLVLGLVRVNGRSSIPKTATSMSRTVTACVASQGPLQLSICIYSYCDLMHQHIPKAAAQLLDLLGKAEVT